MKSKICHRRRTECKRIWTEGQLSAADHRQVECWRKIIRRRLTIDVAWQNELIEIRATNRQSPAEGLSGTSCQNGSRHNELQGNAPQNDRELRIAIRRVP